MNEILLTVRDVANYFAVSKQTVARWYKSGQLQSMRISGGVRFTRQHIADLIGTNEKERQQV